MKIISKLQESWKNTDHPFLIHNNGELYFEDINRKNNFDLSKIKEGDVVAIIGDFDPRSILVLLKLIEKNAIIVPLTKETKNDHKYFIETALVNAVIEKDKIKFIEQKKKHSFIDHLRNQKHGGLILFTTGTTGRPKAILHDLTLFMKRFETPRPSLRTISFLLFDHIGGINTLFHTLFNKGTIVVPKSRDVYEVLKTCAEHKVEVLPTTPTFLRLMLMSDMIPSKIPSSLKIITYGTERMDQTTLDLLCKLLPKVDFRQTYGMSEIGIVRIKSKSRESLFMKIGGEGVETRVTNNVLEIRSPTRMIGYLNTENPFNKDGWYNTKDIVQEKNGYYKISGRTTEVINVGGLKFMASEVERVAHKLDGVELVKVEGKNNPITGQHVEIIIQLKGDIKLDKNDIKEFLSRNLPPHMTPKRINISNVNVGHRFKKN